MKLKRKAGIFICLGCHNEIPQNGQLKQQKFGFLQFWRVKVQDQGASKVAFILKPLSWACRRPSSCSVLTLPFCVSEDRTVSLVSPQKGFTPSDKDPTPFAQSSPNYCQWLQICHIGELGLQYLNFELWCWRRLFRVHWTAGKSNQSILKEINPEHSLEGLMLKLQYVGHLM